MYSELVALPKADFEQVPQYSELLMTPLKVKNNFIRIKNENLFFIT